MFRMFNYILRWSAHPSTLEVEMLKPEKREISLYPQVNTTFPTAYILYTLLQGGGYSLTPSLEKGNMNFFMKGGGDKPLASCQTSSSRGQDFLPKWLSPFPHSMKGVKLL